MPSSGTIPPPNVTDDDDGLGAGGIAGIVIGILTLVVTIVALYYSRKQLNVMYHQMRGDLIRRNGSPAELMMEARTASA